MSTSRLLLVIALTVPTAVLALEGGVVTAVALALFGVTAWSASRPRPTPSGLVQSIILLGTVALLLGAQLASPRPIRFGVGLTALALGLAAPRVAWPIEGRNLGFVAHLGLLALMGVSRTTGRGVYLLAVLLFVGSMLLAVHSANATRASVRGLRGRRGELLPLALGLGLAGGLAAGIGWLLPAAEPLVTEALEPFINQSGQRRSGFGRGRIELGDLTEIIAEDTVVMRVYGVVDHLRGDVYVDYRAGNWDRLETGALDGRDAPDGAVSLMDVGSGRSDSERRVEIEAESGAGGSLFAPLDASALISGPPFTQLGRFGILYLSEELRNERRRWTLAVGGPGRRRITPPTDKDLRIPRRLAPQLKALAAAWSAGAEQPLAKAQAFVRRFHRDFEYSLHLKKAPRRIDPVWHFLTQTRSGHCEFFASGFALLARAAGIPSRMVTGYRVFEWNAVGEYYMVRSRDAHAWVEIFVDGDWQLIDPTPPGVLGGEQVHTSAWDGYLDVAKRWIGKAFDRLAALRMEEIAAALALAFVLLVVFRKLRGRAAHTPQISEPLSVYPALLQLEQLLAQRGFGRPRHRSLSWFVGRLRAGGELEAAELVERCVRLRYGASGEAESLQRAIEGFVGGTSGAERLESQ